MALVIVARFIHTVCTRRIQWSCKGLTSIPQQIRWIQLKHLLPLTMYNLSLPKLSANYYGLPTTVQLRAAHELMFTVWCFAGDWPQVLYCTWLIVYTLDWTVYLGPFIVLEMHLEQLTELIRLIANLGSVISVVIFWNQWILVRK